MRAGQTQVFIISTNIIGYFARFIRVVSLVGQLSVFGVLCTPQASKCDEVVENLLNELKLASEQYDSQLRNSSGEFTVRTFVNGDLKYANEVRFMTSDELIRIHRIFENEDNPTKELETAILISPEICAKVSSPNTDRATITHSTNAISSLYTAETNINVNRFIKAAFALDGFALWETLKSQLDITEIERKPATVQVRFRILNSDSNTRDTLKHVGSGIAVYDFGLTDSGPRLESLQLDFSAPIRRKVELHAEYAVEKPSFIPAKLRYDESGVGDGRTIEFELKNIKFESIPRSEFTLVALGIVESKSYNFRPYVFTGLLLFIGLLLGIVTKSRAAKT